MRCQFPFADPKLPRLHSKWVSFSFFRCWLDNLRFFASCTLHRLCRWKRSANYSLFCRRFSVSHPGFDSHPRGWLVLFIREFSSILIFAWFTIPFGAIKVSQKSLCVWRRLGIVSVFFLSEKTYTPVWRGVTTTLLTRSDIERMRLTCGTRMHHHPNKRNPPCCREGLGVYHDRKGEREGAAAVQIGQGRSRFVFLQLHNKNRATGRSTPTVLFLGSECVKYEINWGAAVQIYIIKSDNCFLHWLTWSCLLDDALATPITSLVPERC